LIRALVPSASAGAVDVKVTTSSGTSAASSADRFTFAVPAAPVVSGVSLNSGSIVGGYTGSYYAYIQGSGFTGATAVSFGGTAATSFSVGSDTLLSALVPSAVAPGTVDIKVTTPGGTSATSAGDQFTYVLPPTPVVTGLSPTSGSVAGNYNIYVSGTGFTDATAVSFGGTPGNLYSVPKPETAIRAVVPSASLDIVYPVAAEKVYPVATSNLNDPSALTTTYSYTFFPNTNIIQSQTTSLPTISTAHNGPGSPDVETTFFDVYGRPIWTKDPDGYIDYTEYDPGTGAVTKSIVDLQTANTSDYNTATLPPGWSTPFSGGLNLVTLYVVDGLGRTTKLTDPNGNITYTVYKDANHEVRTYPGWQTSTNLPTGPTIIMREDFSHSYEDGTYSPSYIETMTISKAPNVTNGQPDGSETFSMSDVQSMSRRYVSAGGQVYRTDDYFNPSGTTYSTDLYLGTAGTNFYSTLYAYDSRGRLYHTTSPTGTISVTDYDGLGRHVDRKLGTSDANLVMTRQYQYDNGGIGDGDLTQETDYPDGSAPARVTQYFYDWRDRLVALKQGVQASENDGTHRPILYYQLDNLGNVLTSQQYAGDGVTITSTNGVPNAPSTSLLRAQTTTEYDEQGRVYQTNVYSVDQTSGAVSANSLTTNTWYGLRGEVIKTSAPGGLVTKSVTDGAGRVTNVYQTDGAGDSTWANASSVVNNNVLSETDTQYDADSNPILVIDKLRFDNETARGALGSPTTTPKARDYYTASYYDAANRLTDQVDVGTNGGMAYTRPSSVPADSPTVLVTDTGYNLAGLVQSVTDPRGVVTENTYDLLGRTTQTVQDYTGGPLSNSSDQTTQYTYDGDGNVLTMTAFLPGSSETTQYTYGVTTATSGLNSNDLLASVTYPANGQPNTESYTYNALGEVTGYTDRNGNTHSYVYDVLGRQISDQVTTLGSGVDGTVRRLDTAFDTRGRPYLYTSYADVAGTTVLNQVQQSYNGLGQLTSEAQSHSGPVNGGTPTVQYSYSFVSTAGGPNNSRPVSMTYPNGRVLNYNYATGVDNTISRLTSISDSSATLEGYTYLGLDTLVQRSHPQNGVNQTYITPGGNPDGGDQYTGLDRFGRVVEQRWVNTNTSSNTDDFLYTYEQKKGGGSHFGGRKRVRTLFAHLRS
jgi:YD repeat-containing protein